jgi:hypothetical protein
MKLDYALLALLMGAVYGLIKLFLPDFPLSQDVFFVLIIYVLVKLGVEIIGQPIRRGLHKLFPRAFSLTPRK